MKLLIRLFIYALYIIACVYFPYRLAVAWNESGNFVVGPEQKVTLTVGETLIPSTNETLNFQSNDYFEINQGGTITQSVYKKSEIAEEDGPYHVDNYPVSGPVELTNSGAKVKHPESEVTIKIIPSEDDKWLSASIAVIIGVLCCFYGILIISAILDKMGIY